ncbi:MAG TPA: hypothetical protein VFA04_26220 [Bryobacteraceae bacterium]|nr:hypothetical protein [Bryobacteraceae bacterium]
MKYNTLAPLPEYSHLQSTANALNSKPWVCKMKGGHALIRREIDGCTVLLRAASAPRNSRMSIGLENARRSINEALERVRELPEQDRRSYERDIGALDRAVSGLEADGPKHSRAVAPEAGQAVMAPIAKESRKRSESRRSAQIVEIPPAGTRLNAMTAACIENRRISEHRNRALSICRNCVQTLREAVGTAYFDECLDAVRDAHDLLTETQTKLTAHREAHGC